MPDALLGPRSIIKDKSAPCPQGAPSNGSDRCQLIKGRNVIQQARGHHRGGLPHFRQVRPDGGEVGTQPLPRRPVSAGGSGSIPSAGKPSPQPPASGRRAPSTAALERSLEGPAPRGEAMRGRPGPSKQRCPLTHHFLTRPRGPGPEYGFISNRRGLQLV